MDAGKLGASQTVDLTLRRCDHFLDIANVMEEGWRRRRRRKEQEEGVPRECSGGCGKKGVNSTHRFYSLSQIL